MQVVQYMLAKEKSITLPRSISHKSANIPVRKNNGSYCEQQKEGIENEHAERNISHEQQLRQ